jgi:type IV pilus assembly protein PilA
MLARIQKSMKEKDEGFTLIELLVVIIIIGILAAIAIPVFLNQRKKGWDSQAKSDARNLATLEETYFTDANNYVVSTSLATTRAALTDYKPSANVTDVLIHGYASAATAPSSSTTSAQAVDGFCVQTTSKSGATFVYDSKQGGLQPGTTSTCA